MKLFDLIVKTEFSVIMFVIFQAFQPCFKHFASLIDNHLSKTFQIENNNPTDYPTAIRKCEDFGAALSGFDSYDEYKKVLDKCE